MSVEKIPCPVCYPASIPAYRPNALACEACHGETYVPASVLERELTAIEMNMIIRAHLVSDHEKANPAARFMFLHNLHRHIAFAQEMENIELH